MGCLIGLMRRISPAPAIRLAGLALATLPLLASAQPQAGPPDPSLPWVTAEVRAPRVTFRRFDSAIVGTPVSYHAYVPASYERTAQGLPVLYWLHATEGGVSAVRPLAQLLDEAMEAGRVPPMIVVFVNGLPRRLWADSKDGASPVEAVFIREVIPDVDRTIASREGRIVEGFSMGGYGAGRFGFKFPELFCGVSMMAAGPVQRDFTYAPRGERLREELLAQVYGGDLAYFRAVSPWHLAEANAERLRSGVAIRMAIGARDLTLPANEALHKHLESLAIPHAYAVLPGLGHDPIRVMPALGEDRWAWYRRVWAQGARVEKD